MTTAVLQIPQKIVAPRPGHTREAALRRAQVREWIPQIHIERLRRCASLRTSP